MVPIEQDRKLTGLCAGSRSAPFYEVSKLFRRFRGIRRCRRAGDRKKNLLALSEANQMIPPRSNWLKWETRRTERPRDHGAREKSTRLTNRQPTGEMRQHLGAVEVSK